MAFETGYAANEFDLQQKLNAFILSIDGWTKISQPDVFDSVYFSSGEDNYKDIYIRTVGGLTENPAQYGGNQRDFSDGYVGFLNFFTYQYFPDDGDGYDGYGEAGKLGPLLCWLRGYNNYDAVVQRFSTAQAGSNNKWANAGYLYTRSDGAHIEYHGFAMNYTNAAFDGKRYFYFFTSDSGFYRFDLANGRTDVLIKRLYQGGQNHCGLAHYTDPNTRKEYVWYYKDNTGNYNLDDGEPDPIGQSDQLKRWSVDDGVLEYGFSGPAWPNTGDRESDEAHMIWDGHNHLYMFRGSSENDWAKYHIPTDTWTLLTDLPAIHVRAENMTWLDMRTSGFDYHRIYWVSNTDDKVYYVNIDGDSGMPVGSWASAGNTPISPRVGACVFHNNVNRWYYYNGSNLDAGLWYAPMSSGSLSWTLIDSSYLPAYSQSDRNTTFAYVDGYASRVRTSLYDRTQYWFLGDADRIIVLTKADDQYNFCYMGAIEPYTSLVPHAKTTADIYAGSSVEIPIDLLKGEFEVGQTVSIVDVTDTSPGAGEIVGEVENIKRKFKPIELVTTTQVVAGVSITVDTLKNNYPSGSRIAYDPQPVGITLGGLDKIQMLNCVNTVNTSGGFDMAENIANLETVSETIVNASGGDDRRGTYALWPVMVMNSGTMDAFSGEELRGGLIGVFAVSSEGSLTSGDTIVVGSNTYMIFEVPSAQSFLYVFGPIQEE